MGALDAHDSALRKANLAQDELCIPIKNGEAAVDVLPPAAHKVPKDGPERLGHALCGSVQARKDPALARQRGHAVQGQDAKALHNRQE